MSTITPATLAAELAAATPTLSAEQQQLALSLYRLLADGRPVEPDRLATRTGLAPEQVTELLGDLPGVYLDDRERVIGFWGLTIRPIAHRMLVDDRVLYAWCAWDTLFLPELIGKPARVQSTCPATGTAISLTVYRREVTDVVPTAQSCRSCTATSHLTPTRSQPSGHYVHFFADRASAEQWTREHDGTFVLSLARGAEIARLANATRFPAIGRDGSR